MSVSTEKTSSPSTKSIRVDEALPEVLPHHRKTTDGDATATPDKVAVVEIDQHLPASRAMLVCIVLLTIMGLGVTMFFAKAILLPILFAFLLNFFFSPIVTRLGRWGIPSFVTAIGLMLGSIVILVGIGLIAFQPAKDWLNQAPETIRQVEVKLRELRKPMDEIQKTGQQLDDMVSGKHEEDQKEYELNIPFAGKVSLGEKKAEAPVGIAVQQPSISGFILDNTSNAIIGISLTVVILFFLLAAGDRGLEKMVELMPTWHEKRNVVEMTRSIQSSISRYMFTTTLINIGLGIVIGFGLWLVGVPNPVLWGVMVILLNYLPFVGGLIGAAIVFVVAAVTFDSLAYSLLAPGVYLGANAIEANFITPFLLGRSISLHPVWLMIFFAFLAWVWGVAGAIVAVPTLALIKITCDHIEPLKPVGRFLGR